MLFHFDFGNYRRMLRLAWGETSPRARRRALAVLLLWVPPVALFHAVCFFLDGLLFPSLWTTRVRAPVFVLGHARSGTTLVHRLMSLDEGRFSTFALYELYFPSLLQKKLIRAGASLDRRLLGGLLTRRVAAWEGRRYAAVRRVHEMGLTQPEEDDIVLYHSMASGFWISRMPFLDDVDFYGVDAWPARRRRRLMRFYADCVRRQLVLSGTDKVHLSKNPIFAGRVEALIERFPDARFVVPVRDPLETIPSLLKLVSGGWKHLGWSAERVRTCQRALAEQSFHTYRHPLEVLERHPEVRSVVVDYRELSADPAAALERIYRELDLPMSGELRQVLGRAGAGAREHRSGHAYSLDEFGLDGAEIRARLADLYARFGWGGEAPASASSAGEAKG